MVELKSCNINEDPVRPELDIKFRTSYGRNIFELNIKKKFVQLCVLVLQMKFQKLLRIRFND